ncbi:MAG: cell envelope integrity protein TolA [Nitrospinae bacterium]|nr:cell envelope integrity protein TolA [Nitrospinota bacterium]
MNVSTDPSIKLAAPGTALQQMCNYIAIAETKSPEESLQELILHTLLTFEEEKASSIQDVAKILSVMFGIEAQDHQVQKALDHLTSSGQVYMPMGTNYVLLPDTRQKVKERIDQASQLQERVKMQWISEITQRFSDLNPDLAWTALHDYLAKAFLRHGIQVAVFLDPSVELPSDYAKSLSRLLTEAVNARFDPPLQASAKHAITDFLGTVGKNSERARFIAECADGATNYFSLAVSPEVAARFREKLSQLMLFCDTNFLFGILGLHVHHLVEVSNELLDAVTKHKLPLKLRYHEATLRELISSISYYCDVLHRRRWTQSLSRAATTSSFMSGIELKYHQKNAETGIDVDTFFQPYKHMDVLLENKGIEVFQPQINRLEERATLEAEYKEFLESINKEKSYDLIAHDVAVLDCVRTLRKNGTSTLEAGALFVTCDYMLYRFDSDASRKANAHASVVLPNILWQILRPFVPASQDFDRSFAETFAMPEFRTIGSGAAKACSRMLGLLATYKDFPEETAKRMLSNDRLIDGLRTTNSDEEFQALIESAIAAENQMLLGENAAKARQIEALRSDKERAENELNEQKQVAAIEAAKAHETIQAKELEKEALANSQKDAETNAKDTSAKFEALRLEKDSIEEKANQEALLRQKAEARYLTAAKIASILVSLLIIMVFELAVNFVWPWNWLMSNSNSYGLQAGFCLIVSSVIVGFWVKPWRNFCWGAMGLGALLVMVQILGGPANVK